MQLTSGGDSSATSSYGTISDAGEEEGERLLQPLSHPDDELKRSPLQPLPSGRLLAGRIPYRWLAFAVVTACTLFFVGWSGTNHLRTPSSPTAEASAVASAFSATLRLSNAYELKAGTRIGDGLYPYEHLADIHRDTICDMTVSPPVSSCTWTFGSHDRARTAHGCRVTHAWSQLGRQTILVELRHDDGSLSSREYTVHVKYVRYELRELERSDRERYLSAVDTLYRVDSDEGRLRWGPNYRSAAWLIREHLYGAASKMCDHWHDDAGFANHHIGITWQFEQAIQAVDPTVAAHYWDYTIDAAQHDSTQFAGSIIFSEDWFGISSPSNPSHIVDHGRFAYLAVQSSARDFSDITNPYGLLRSPWNTNPTPFLLRFDHVLGQLHDAYMLTTCHDFAHALQSESSMAAFVSKLNGKLHGPIHIMIGGHWWYSPMGALNNSASVDTSHGAADWLGSTTGSRSRALLASKFLWRQGYIRCPDVCSADVNWRECACTCPTELVGSTDADAYVVLNKTGLLQINRSWRHPELFGTTWRSILVFLCHVGHPGEMFTSAAPQDPTFWPLHGNAERFLHLLRLLDAYGAKQLDQSWGYAHVTTGLDSDTHVVCDWDGVQGMQLPACQLGATCPGHRQDDLLPFWLFEGQTQQITNAEFYNVTSPLSPDLPYVYDRLTYWPACTNQTIWYQPIDEEPTSARRAALL